MQQQVSIKQLYALALAEGEGVGTAYEYYAKRLILQPWLASARRPGRLLVAGLPQKYGASLDLLLLGAEMGCRIVVVDDRQEALSRLAAALQCLARRRFTPALEAQLLLTGDLAKLSELSGGYELAVSSEVIQRFPQQQRLDYALRLLELSANVALFAPNIENRSHVGRSGLNGLSISESRALLRHAGDNLGAPLQTTSGFIDMPPFPPGISRTSSQRVEAATGTAEAIAMWALGYYARAERIAPLALRRQWSHIVYTLNRLPPR